VRDAFVVAVMQVQHLARPGGAVISTIRQLAGGVVCGRPLFVVPSLYLRFSRAR